MKSKRQFARRGFVHGFLAALAALTTLMIGASLPLHGQANALGSLTQGQPVVANGTGSTGQTASSSPVFVDVTKFQQGVLTADWCSRVNAAYVSAASSAQGVVLDARGFPAGSTQLCSSQPFAPGSGGATPFWLLVGPYTVVTSVGWGLPQQQHIITGVGTPGSGSSGTILHNTVIQACGPGSVAWNSTNMNCGSSAYPQFPGSGPTLSFTWPHGPAEYFSELLLVQPIVP